MTTSAGPVLVIGHPPPQSSLQSLLHTIYRFALLQLTYCTPSRVLMSSPDFRPPIPTDQAAAKLRSPLSAWSRPLAAREARRSSQRPPRRPARSATHHVLRTCSTRRYRCWRRPGKRLAAHSSAGFG